MGRSSPLWELHQAYLKRLAEHAGRNGAATHRPGAAVGQRLVSEIETIPYGPIDAADGEPACDVIALYDTVETEYAALRRGAGIMDCPHRGTIIVTGEEGVDFLNRMLTQQLADFAPGDARSSFLVNRKGRVVADLFLVAAADRVCIDVDVHQAASTVAALEQFLFAEDVQITDATERWHRIAVHGPESTSLIDAVAGGPGSLSAQPAGERSIADTAVLVARHDQTGDPGYELFLDRDSAPAVWTAIVDAAEQQQRDGPRHHRPVGWYAWNIARIEAGTPLMNIDFDPSSLPHETALVDSRVSFRKGCYPGQEIVARMQNLGAPKQRLVGLRVAGDVLPVAGSEVFAAPAADDGGSFGDPVGVVTSSTLSPMLGARPIALAMTRTKHTPMDATVVVAAEGETARATVVPLTFWSRGEAGDAS